VRAALLLALLAAPAFADDETLDPLPAVDPGAAFDAAADARKDELGKTAYEFCHDEDYDPLKSWGDRRFCKTWDARTAEACPEARTLCKDKEPPWWAFDFPDMPPLVGWFFLISALLVGLAFFIRALIRESASSDIDLGSVVDDAMGGQLQSLPEAPSRVMLRKARENLDSGKVDEAAVLVQLACLRYFDDTGWVTFHPSKTNGEYLRAVRRSPRHHDLYRRIARETDRLRFGGGRADKDPVSACLDDAETLLREAPPQEAHAATAVLGILFVIFSQQGCGDESKPYYSHRPTGFSALPALLKKVGLEVSIGRHRVDEIPEDVGVVVMFSSLPSKIGALSLDGLLDRDVRVVVIDDAGQASHYLPVTTSSVALALLGKVLSIGNEEPPSETIFVEDTDFCGVNLGWIDARLGRDRILLPASGALVETSETGTVTVSKDKVWIEPLLLAVHDSDRMTARAYGGIRVDTEHADVPKLGCTLLFGSSDLFTNASLTLPQNARFVASLFASLTMRGKKVMLLDALDPAKSGVARSMAESRLLPFIVHGLAWVAILFVFLGAAFGPLRDTVKIEHKAFVEHVEALGRQYARLGDAGLAHIAKSLARYAVLRHRIEARGGWVALAGHLAEKYELPEASVRTALRLGSDTAVELGPPVSAKDARSDEILRVLSVLITGRARRAKR